MGSWGREMRKRILSKCIVYMYKILKRYRKKLRTKQNIGLQVFGFNMDKIKFKAGLSGETMLEL